ncbi:hypothetical protein [Gemmiger sp.]|uniref:hypothetical protein n=1 Tax=Gemmiger sp. TaxID=2049027 RepID=UPI003A90D4C6
MTTHTITLARHTAQVVGLMGVLVLGTWDSYGTEQLLLRHGPEWEGLAIDATFHNTPSDEGVTVLADTDGLVTVPPEACMRASKYATITFRGVQDGVQRISCNLPYMVLDHAQVPGANSTATPSEIAQALAQMQDLRDGAVDAKRHAEAARDAAANSATAVAASEKAAASSAVAAAGSAAQAEAQRTAAAKSATAAAGSATAAAGDAKTASDAAAGAADAKAAAVAAQKDAAASKAAAANSSTAAKTSEDAAAKSAADADSTANSINNSMMQIAANREAVSQLKEDISNKITKFYASNQGETHLADSDNGKIMDMMVYGKSSQDGTPTPDNPVEIKSVVNPKVKVFDENGTESQTVTIPYTLNAIPVSSGGNVTIGAQQYISDYLDIEKGKLYRKVKRLNLKDAAVTNITHGFHSNGNGFLSIAIENTNKDQIPISNRYKGSMWTQTSGYVYVPNSNSIVLVDDRFTDKQTAINLVQDTYVIYALSSPTEEDLSLEQIKFLKSLATNYPVTNITIGSEQLDGYTVFNYPISMQNGWNYVKQQLNDNRDYIYDMDLQSAEAYVNSEYAVALTELEV